MNRIIPVLQKPSWADNFDRADNASVIGGKWTTVSGTWGILSNHVYAPSGSGIASWGNTLPQYFVADMGISFYVDTTYYFIPCILFRYMNSTKYLRFYITDTDLSLYKIDGGGATAVFADSITLLPNIIHKVKLIIAPTKVQVWVNESLRRTVNNPDLTGYTGSQIGLQGMGNTSTASHRQQAYVDYIKITKL